MTFINKTGQIEKTIFGVIVGNRDVFPDHLAKEGRVEIINLLKELGYEHVILGENDTEFGVVRSYEDAKKCAKLFKENREKIGGILVILPNFGDEKGIVNTIKMANLNVPILIQASSDEVDKMNQQWRRDAFCGKISVTNVLYQHGIPFSLTDTHTCPINSKEFKADIKKFDKVCRIVNKIRSARLGQIGTRPDAFSTVRYSEKILEFNGMTVDVMDLSEVLAAIKELKDDDENVKEKLDYLKSYTSTKDFLEEGVLKLAKLIVVIENWILENDLDGFAFQCWPSIQDNFGIVPCAALSVFSESLVPAACEVDISGLVAMLILQCASEMPSAILDWNNNYGEDPNKMVLFHCSNFPKSHLEETEMKTHDIISSVKEPDITFGTIQGRVKSGPCTLLRVETDDIVGEMKAIIAEGEYTTDPLNTYGGYGVVEVENLQNLLKVLCYEGFAHHVAGTLKEVADIIIEALTVYLDWNVITHS